MKAPHHIVPCCVDYIMRLQSCQLISLILIQSGFNRIPTNNLSLITHFISNNSTNHNNNDDVPLQNKQSITDVPQIRNITVLMQKMQSVDLTNGQQQRSSAIGDPADVQLLKEWNIDRFFSRDDEKRHSTQSAIVSPVTNNSGSGVKEVSAAVRLERQVHREIISSKPKQTIAVQSPGKSAPGDNKDKLGGPSATESGGNFMKNFSFIKNFKREKSDLFPMSKRHSSEISYNVNVTKYISAAGSPGSISGASAAPNRSSVMERSASGTARNTGPAQVPSGASLLRAGPRREKTESVILRRNSTQVTAKQAEDARVRASIISRAGLGEVQHNSSAGAAVQSINNNNSNPNMIDLKSNVAGDGGSRFYGDQVIFNLLLCR